MDSIFKVVANNNKLVVLEITANDPLTIAMNPYISGDWKYITVTKGVDHVLTVTKNNGKTFSFDWGLNGYTLISDNLENLRINVVNFIKSKHISIERA